MKKQFIIFFAIVLSVYGAINFYIFFRGWHALAFVGDLRPWLLAFFMLLALAYPVGRFLERVSLSRFTEYLVYTGAVWLAEMVYLFLFVAAIDIVHAVIALLSKVGVFSYSFNEQWSASLASLVFILSTVITAAGFINARFPKIRPMDLTVPRRSSTAERLEIVMVSDIHLGTIMGPRRLRYIVDKINTIGADLVLLAGDVFDEDIGRVIKNNLGELLRQIRAPQGIFAVTGNHEYFGGADEAVRYLRDHGVRVLRDEAVEIGTLVTIAGREDRSFRGANGERRKTIPGILAQVRSDLPVILMDHQPLRLNESVEAGVALQLSGHTHHGQLWPFNFITKKVYEVSRGYKRIGDTQVIVSCGAGTWGPPVRTGNTPEIIHLTTHFS